MNLVYVYYDDADYLDTHKVDYTKCVGLDVATSYLDESWTSRPSGRNYCSAAYRGLASVERQPCTSQTELATVEWDTSRWTAFESALFMKGQVYTKYGLSERCFCLECGKRKRHVDVVTHMPVAVLKCSRCNTA
ncbi:hypothetical protein DYB32_006703 [Aphanomyces invadans]|uniref:Uncharacterized protein n=1 Tax=Aphanomyces invadans TaxID=157072 RepID=A0A418AQZ3_9STRA|nr:hypothetical protein DYB32_006703 [Aphanomyces invadans]